MTLAQRNLNTIVGLQILIPLSGNKHRTVSEEDVSPYSTSDVYGCFEEAYCFRLQDRRISQRKNKQNGIREKLMMEMPLSFEASGNLYKSLHPSMHCS
jgi:hypothetical protein